MTDKISGVENAGQENCGQEFDGQEIRLVSIPATAESKSKSTILKSENLTDRENEGRQHRTNAV